MNKTGHVALPLDLPFAHTQILKAWQLPTNYQICKILGQGAYGCVIQALNKDTNQLVAIKRIAKLFTSLDDTKRILREITLLRKMNHPNIIKILDLFIEGDDKQTFNTIYVVMEYFPSDLKKLFKSPIFLTQKHVQLLSFNILKALEYLQSVNILHRDLKPENILINEDCEVKLCDFGLARTIGNFDQELHDIDSGKKLDEVTSPEMSSPEIKQFNKKMQITMQSCEKNTNEKPNVNGLSNAAKKRLNQQPILNLQNNLMFKKVQEMNQKKECEEIAEENIISPLSPGRKQSFNKEIQTCLKRFSIKKKAQTEIIHSRSRICSADGIDLQSGKKTVQRSLKRGLTKHVVTRWYRAPEIILVEKNYTQAIDVWSLGCIFAELQNTIKENVADYKKRKALFPGSSCFPLSPKVNKPTDETEEKDNESANKKDFPQQKEDQLNLIFSIIGTPEEEELNFITDKNAVKYIKSFKKWPKKDLSTLYPASSKDALEILDKALQFNPVKRINLEELINHKYFTKLKNNKDKQPANIQLIEMDFENEEELTINVLRKYFIEELTLYQIY